MSVKKAELITVTVMLPVQILMDLILVIVNLALPETANFVLVSISLHFYDKTCIGMLVFAAQIYLIT